MQNVTLKENILFGKVLNNRIYERAIDACALRSDIAILPGGDQVTILPTFYKQLLCAQILKVQKDTDDLTVFLRFWDLCS
jgi:hypothetical protein